MSNFGSTFADSSYYGEYTRNYGSSNYTRRMSDTGMNSLAKKAAGTSTSDFLKIQEYLQKNDNSAAASLMDELRSSMKDFAETYRYDLSDSQIETLIDSAYSYATNGETIEQTIEANTDSSFLASLKDDLLGWTGLYVSDSTEEVKEKVLKTDLSDQTKASADAGSIVGKTILGGTVATAAIATVAGWCGGASGIASAFSAIGGAIASACPYVLPIVGVGIAGYALYKACTK